MTLRYSDATDSWLHSFVTRPLLEEDIEHMLAECGFGHFTWLGSIRRWIVARA
jgi:hypothetical protein